MSVFAGCHRQYYRKQADSEAQALMAQKAACVARPSNADLSIQVDRRSRMYNPFDLDFQPMPLDDPASYRYMQCVDNRRGYPLWEAAGFTNTVESPDWYQFLPIDDDGVMVLNLENSVQIALLHSPEYQRQVEQLYLSALDVSTQRFAFDTQLFSNQGLTFQNTDNEFGQVNTSNSNLGLDSNTIELNRRFATGGNLIVGLANEIVWNFGGFNGNTISSNAFFSFTQPLLRGGGRAIALEGLTQAERNLLADVRSFERFRRSFFLNITIGRNLEGQIAGNPFSVSGTGFNVSTSGLGNTGGYLGLLQTQINIRNLEENISRQTENVLVLQESLLEALTTIPDNPDRIPGIVRQRLLVEQAKEGLVSSQLNLVNSQASYQRDVDDFLISLGLPPYVCARIEDDFLKRFELINPQLLARREDLSTLRTETGEINVSMLENVKFISDETGTLPVAILPWDGKLGEKLVTLKETLRPLSDLTFEIVESDLEIVASDIDQFEEVLPKRRLQAEQLRKVYETNPDTICSLLGVKSVDSSLFDITELETLSDELRGTLEEVSKRLKGYTDDAVKLNERLAEFLEADHSSLTEQEIAAVVRSELILESQQLLSNVGDDVLALQLIQARARTESVVLPDVKIDAETAFHIARRNRRDYANAKAVVVDVWRNIEVTANALESGLGLTTSGSLVSTDSNLNPFQNRVGEMSVGLQWDSPLTRLIERNDYRAQLIAFDRVKRDFYRFEDSLWRLLRDEVRQLEANRLTFEMSRQSIRIAAAQVGLNADIRADEVVRGLGAGATAARDAINALAALLNAQNNLLDIFVSYETLRRSLDLDLGTMQLTPDGAWLDPGEIDAELLMGLPGTVDGAPTKCECGDCGLCYDPPPRSPDYHVPMIESDQLPLRFSDEGRGTSSIATQGVEYGLPGEVLFVPAAQPDEAMEILGPEVSIEAIDVK
ncbi:MAG: hypothetical protein AAF664_13090 [Planctomycetota bacterium]